MFSAAPAAPAVPTDPDIAPPNRCRIEVVRLRRELKADRGATLEVGIKLGQVDGGSINSLGNRFGWALVGGCGKAVGAGGGAWGMIRSPFIRLKVVIRNIKYLIIVSDVSIRQQLLSALLA